MPRAPRHDAHIAAEELLRLAEAGRPDAAARTHLERCQPCQAALAEAEGLIDDLRSSRLVEPPASVVARAVALFPDRPALVERVVEALARLVRGAESLAPAMAGVRGEATAPARLLFAGDGLEIDLELARLAESMRVSGQVLADDARRLPLLVWAEHEGHHLAEAPVSGLGTFVLEGVTAPVFDLVLDSGASRVRIRIPSGAEA